MKNELKFLKMNGLGNDFVIIDEREAAYPLSVEAIAKIGDRHFGVGFDQFVSIRQDDEADAHIIFWNQDGSSAGACGNATRCVASLLMHEADNKHQKIRTERGILEAKLEDDGLISVNMGQPIFDWQEIPLSQDVDINALPIDGAPMAVGMGNPHCLFFVDDAENVALEERGPIIEHHALFPNRTNVEFLSLLGKDHLRMRVWERGGMITLACGSGACAAAVAAHRRGLTGKTVQITADGGDLWIDWREDGVWMKGAVSTVFEGHLSSQFLEGEK